MKYTVEELQLIDKIVTSAVSGATAKQRPKNLLNWLRWLLGYSYKMSIGDPYDIVRISHQIAAAVIWKRRELLEDNSGITHDA